MQLAADPLFEIGNHGWTHGNLRVLSGEAAEQQIQWTQAQYALLRRNLVARAEQKGVAPAEIAQIPAVPLTLRFPFGTCSRATLDMAARFGLPAVQWEVVSADASPGRSARQVAEGALARIKSGSIVVFHANGRGSGTADALPQIIGRLRAAGYRFVTVSELLRAGEPVTAPECYEERPGDNLRYDTLFGAGTG
jgi:peptidoglycan/xylan/chitin deacetylase (PgdA/CDA1 family)